MKTSCYANKTCLSIHKEHRINNTHMMDKGNLKEDFNKFKNLMINKFESMKFYFFRKQIPLKINL